jgi:hypothetical protein
MRTRHLIPVLALAGALAMSACGSSAANTGVASLEGDTASGTTDTTAKKKEATQEERQQAMLDFAKCMRDHGVDMPDPQFTDGGGGALVKVNGGASAADSETVEKAQQACQSIMEDVVGDIDAQLSPEEQERMKQQALDFAKCMRDHGVDMPDPQFGEGGRVSIQMGGKGMDPNDPKFEDAQKACGAAGGFTIGGKANG